MPINVSMSVSFRGPGVGSVARACLAGGLLVLLLAGCATGDVEMLATITGGKQLRVPIGRGGVEPAREDGVEVKLASFILNQDKKPIYAFALSDSRARAVRQIRVEDVSDETAVTLVDDTDPKVPANGTWNRETAPIELGDPRLAWLVTISNTLRVYRFTVTFADGRTLVLHQGALFSAHVKEAMRQTLAPKA